MVQITIILIIECYDLVNRDRPGKYVTLVEELQMFKKGAETCIPRTQLLVCLLLMQLYLLHLSRIVLCFFSSFI